MLLLSATLSVRPAQAQLFVRATLDGTQSGTGSLGQGTLYGQFSSDLKTLTYRITVAKLQDTITAAHFHFSANGSVIEPITFHGNTATGTWDIPDTLLKYFFTQGIYANVHTAAFRNGEIRGTLNMAQVLFTVALDSTLEGSGSTALGTGWFRLSQDTVTSLKYSITFAGLGTAYKAMHVHALPSGNVVHPLSAPDSGTASGVWSGFADSILTLLLRGQLYVNVHSMAFPNGEIRGTIMPSGDIPFVAAIDGSNADTSSHGTGTAWAVLNSDLSKITYSVTYAKLLGTYSASHFHTSTTGGVIHPVTFLGQTSTGQWTAPSDVNIQDLLQGRVYVNIHSSAALGGEINGTLHFYDGTFTTTLDGAQAGTSSTGRGTGWIHYGLSDNIPDYQVTFAGLTSTYTAAHFHIAPAGTVVFPLSFPDTATASGSWPLADTLMVALAEGNIYVNVHSTADRGGEIRGNFAEIPPVVASVAQSSPNSPGSFTLDQNYPNPFNPSTIISYRLSQSSPVSLKVYDLLGRVVATLVSGVQQAGAYRIVFDARSLASGLYFYRLQASNLTQVKKMILLK